jgi:hypothetical protein
MIYLITGTPGSGKTLRAMWMLLNDKALKGRVIYSNIEGASHPSIPNDDWRDTPEGSVVVYDEAQRVFRPRKQGSQVPDLEAQLETHRHTGHDILLVTQHPKLITTNVRALVGYHCHVTRMMGGHVADLAISDRTMNIGSRTELKAALHETWKYPKKLFGTYKSATVHTHKVRIPPALKRVAIIAIVGIPLVIWQLSNTFLARAVSDDVTPNVVERPSPSPVKVAEVETAPASVITLEPPPSPDVFSGCMESARGCRCYTVDGMPAPITEDACRDLMSGTLPMPIGVQQRRGMTDGWNMGGGARTPPSARPASTGGVERPAALPPTNWSGAVKG